MESNFGDVYVGVKSKVKEYGERPFDFAELRRRDKIARQVQENAIHNAKVEEEWKKDMRDMSAQRAMFAPADLIRRRSIAIDRVSDEAYNTFAAEAFAYIYRMALPHDQEFVNENWGLIEDIGKAYMRKLGGYAYLKKVAENSIFLKKMLNFCTEAAKKRVKKKTTDLSKAMTDEAIDAVINGGIEQKEKDELLRNIDTLGAEELAELIKEKVVSVVKDEHQREKLAGEFRKDLANDIAEDESDVDAEVTDADIKEGNKEEKDAEAEANESFAVNNRSFKQAIEDWNPVTRSFGIGKDYEPKSLFFSMATDIARSMIKAQLPVQEGIGTANPINTGKAPVGQGEIKSADTVVKQTSILPDEGENKLINNPLNLDILSRYMTDNREIDKQWRDKAITEPRVVAKSGTPPIDRDAIMTEAVLQYALLETAYTMKLINPTNAEIKEQANHLLGIA